jgi:hypothetical protein
LEGFREAGLDNEAHALPGQGLSGPGWIGIKPLGQGVDEAHEDPGGLVSVERHDDEDLVSLQEGLDLGRQGGRRRKVGHIEAAGAFSCRPLKTGMDP